MVSVEALKRLEVAKGVAERYADISSGIIMTGSVAYAPEKVRVDSDVDVIVISDKMFDVAKDFVDPLLLERLGKRYFDGYCFKRVDGGVPLSLHVLRENAFEVVCRSFVSDLRLYRPHKKSEDYSLRNFEGKEYKYWINNIDLQDLNGGVRSIVPVSFINDDRYFVGIHRDKLLSNPIILHDSEDKTLSRLDTMWDVVVENLRDEALRLYGELDLSKMGVLNALVKREKMSTDVQESITVKTKSHLEKLSK